MTLSDYTRTLRNTTDKSYQKATDDVNSKRAEWEGRGWTHSAQSASKITAAGADESTAACYQHFLYHAGSNKAIKKTA